MKNCNSEKMCKTKKNLPFEFKFRKQDQFGFKLWLNNGNRCTSYAAQIDY